MFSADRDASFHASPFGSSHKKLSMSPSTGSPSNLGRTRFRPVTGVYENSMVSGRSLGTSITIEEAPTHKVLSYGQTLPVQISEALANRSTGPISCKLGSNGWAWLNTGRKFLVWRYVPSAVNKAITCCELNVSATDLYHKADLTSVVSLAAGDGAQTVKDASASVINVSPEGVVRLWPNLANPGIFLEASAGLRGKEFYTLASLPPHCCAVMTTDSDIVLITPSQSSITCRVLNVPSGLFSGIGKRMSSFLLRSTAVEKTIHPPKFAVGPPTDFADGRYLYVLANGNLQKWEVKSGKEKLLCQVDLVEKLTEEVLRVVQVENGSLVKVVPLDAKSTGYCLAVLCCAVIRTDDVLKAILLLGTVQSSGQELSGDFQSFIPLEYSFEIEDEHEIPEVELLIPAGSYQAFVYNRDLITSNPVSEVREGLVAINFPNESSKIVGGGSFGKESVFLSKRHGLFTVIPYYKDTVSSVLRPEEPKVSFLEKSTLNTTMNQSKLLHQRLNQDNAGGEQNLKDIISKAFLEHSAGNIFEATEIVSMISSDEKINEAVVAVSKEIVDSIPASDPRWAQHASSGGQVTSNSVLIMRQLEDKERVFEFFLNFLEEVDLFDKLTLCREGDVEYYTKFKLCEHVEKLNAAKALQTINLRDDKVMQKAIEAVIERRREDRPGNHLTDQDIFFREVSRIQDLFPVLSEYEAESLEALRSTVEQTELIMAVNSITIAALKNAWVYRQTKATFYHPAIENEEEIVKYIPWAGTSETGGIRSVLRQQISLTEEKCMQNTDNASISSVLLQQAVDLADLLLDGYSTQLQFLNPTREDFGRLKSEFETERRAVIEPLVAQEHYKMALALAEKYEDFALMIVICDRENDVEKLERYKTTFAGKGFIEFLFQWYMDKGEWGKLLNQGASSHLENFLESHKNLRWLHFIGIGDYSKASEALYGLAKEETTYLARKKTMLSISKLCLLSSEEERTVVAQKLEGIQIQLDIILHQETLPAVVIENSGLDPNNSPPLSVEDLIQLYTGEENPEANEYDFKRALDLIPFVEPAKKEFLWNQTWDRVILRDDWSENVTMDPLVIISDTVFYKCARLFENEAPDLLSVLPRIESFQTSEELQQHELSSNENFLFLIKAFYESLAAS